MYLVKLLDLEEKRELSFISGYNEKTYSGDKEKLARGVGLLLLEIGILTLLLPIGLEFIGSITEQPGVIVVASISSMSRVYKIK